MNPLPRDKSHHNYINMAPMSAKGKIDPFNNKVSKTEELGEIS